MFTASAGLARAERGADHRGRDSRRARSSRARSPIRPARATTTSTPTTSTRRRHRCRRGWRIGGTGLGVLSVLLGIGARALRSTEQSGSTGASDIIVPQYSPPDDINIMLAAYLIGRPKTAFPAQIVELAVRKKLRLLDHPEGLDERAVRGRTARHRRPDPARAERVVTALFGQDAALGTRRALIPDDPALGRAFGPIQREVEGKLRSEGLRDTSRPTAGWSVLLALTVIIGIAGGRRLPVSRSSSRRTPRSGSARSARSSASRSSPARRRRWRR